MGLKFKFKHLNFHRFQQAMQPKPINYTLLFYLLNPFYHLIHIKNSYIQNIIVKSDSLVLVSFVNKGSTYNSSVGLVFEDCRTLVHNICRCILAHVRHSTNQVAHCLAKASISRYEVGEWKGCPSPFLQHVLASDLV